MIGLFTSETIRAYLDSDLRLAARAAAKQTHRFEIFVHDREGRKSNRLEYLFTVVEGERKSL